MNNIYKQDIKLDFDDVLITPRSSSVSSRAHVNLLSKLLTSMFEVPAVGLVAANMDGVGTIEVAQALQEFYCLTALNKHYDVQTLIEYFSSPDTTHSFYSMGISDTDFDKFEYFYRGLDEIDVRRIPLKICIDVANGYMDNFVQSCDRVRQIAPNAIIMAGNVVDADGAERLSSVDIVKIGIGSGSNCLTRTQTGVGYPQFSAIYDTAPATKQIICSDGGCVSPGDASKAIAAGADMVMIGGMLAGTDQGGGDVIEGDDGKSYVEFYGMSSQTAQRKYNGGLMEYRSSEGRTTNVPYVGDVRNIIRDILGGIRSTCAYVGINEIDELHTNSSFIRVNSTINRTMEKYTVGN